MVSDSSLFRPIKMGSLTLQHRVVLAPVSRMRCDANHVPVDISAKYYAQRATPGGLLITESTGISDTAGSFPGMPCIYTDEQVQGWKKVTDAVHAKGGFIFLQLWHGGRSATPEAIGGKQPISASPIAIQVPNMFSAEPYPVPHPLTVEELKEVVNEYVQCAKNAMVAGFDGVEIHGANSYLIHQFLATQSNTRTDAYGGSIENRARFALEIVEAISNAIGTERVAIRFSPWNTYFDVKDDTLYETYDYVLKQLQEKHSNLAYVHFVEPRDDALADLGVTGMEDHSRETMDPFRAIWKGPFISAGGYSTRLDVAFDTAEKTGNLIAFGRTFIANPDLVERLKNGWDLNKYDRDTFYVPGEKGYTDYPFYQ